jgi:hypothetical protein
VVSFYPSPRERNAPEKNNGCANLRRVFTIDYHFGISQEF